MPRPRPATEANVETKFIDSLLADPSLLAIPQELIKSKAYLAPTSLDKKSGKTHGYIPDYSVWIDALPLLIVEAKAPNVATAVGYREAGLYALHLNKQFRPGLNPCSILIATNGKTLAVGNWDAEPEFEINVSDLALGTAGVQRLRDICGYQRMTALATKFKQRLRPANIFTPYMLAGGAALINSKKPSNTFAAPLSPVLRRYFTSKQQNTDPEHLQGGIH